MLEQQLMISEEQVITPLVEVLESVSSPRLYTVQSSAPISQTISKSMDVLFPEQKHEDRDLQKAKDILGDVAKEFTTEQLKDALTEIQFLCESWLDDFEREVFNGLTLQELLHEKGGL